MDNKSYPSPKYLLTVPRDGCRFRAVCLLRLTGTVSRDLHRACRQCVCVSVSVCVCVCAGLCVCLCFDLNV